MSGDLEAISGATTTAPTRADLAVLVKNRIGKSKELSDNRGANARAALPCLGSFWRGLLKQDRRTARIRAVPPASSRPTSQATGEAGRIRRRADNGDEVAPPAGSRRFARRLTAALLVNGGYRCGEPDAGASRCSRRGTCPAGV